MRLLAVDETYQEKHGQQGKFLFIFFHIIYHPSQAAVKCIDFPTTTAAATTIMILKIIIITWMLTVVVAVVADLNPGLVKRFLYILSIQYKVQ